ncbi:MAG: cytochrome ubiquinol oxidase subunit I [Holophagales bacterium]|jgi:cytochrome d ubiquinol oxidase subunit I|nr:cytochrome ubiquinol oxidase subunit I [Holophagales bacterium]
MDVLILSRLQFAMAACFHFLFVPLTLGLAAMIAIMETMYIVKRDEDYKRMAKFWGKLFLINFAVGLVTGITLEFQFGTNWSRYSAFVGDIFGSLLAIEATAAFFLESTFIAVWFFGWNKLSPKAHCATIWIVAAATNISAFWILSANAWMQHPVGYVFRNGRAELANFMEIITQKYAIIEFFHTLGGAYILSGFFVLGISAWHLTRKNEIGFFTKSFKIAAAWTLVFALGEICTGHLSASNLKDAQPAKLAAIESHWETGRNVPMTLFVWPDADNEKNTFEALKVPGALSILADGRPDTEVAGLRDFDPEKRPPVLPIFLSFRIMVGFGCLFVFMAAWAWLKRRQIAGQRLLLRLLPFMIPLPYLVNQFGWIVAEIGRQPWIVYGLMRTSEAVSPIKLSQVATSLFGFFAVYALLGAIDFYLLLKFARKGPKGANHA